MPGRVPKTAGSLAALIDGGPGILMDVNGRTKLTREVMKVDDKIVHSAMLAVPDTLEGLDLDVYE